MAEAMMTGELLKEQFKNLVLQTLVQDEDKSTKTKNSCKIITSLTKKVILKTVHYNKN